MSRASVCHCPGSRVGWKPGWLRCCGALLTFEASSRASNPHSPPRVVRPVCDSSPAPGVRPVRRLMAPACSHCRGASPDSAFSAHSHRAPAASSGSRRLAVAAESSRARREAGSGEVVPCLEPFVRAAVVSRFAAVAARSGSPVRERDGFVCRVDGAVLRRVRPQLAVVGILFAPSLGPSK